MTAKYGLAPRPKSERPTAAERAAARADEQNGSIAAELASWIPGAGGAGAADAGSSSTGGGGEASSGASNFLGLT